MARSTHFDPHFNAMLAIHITTIYKILFDKHYISEMMLLLIVPDKAITHPTIFWSRMKALVATVRPQILVVTVLPSRP